MKVKDLLREIIYRTEKHGIDFLDWDVYTEQCSEYDKNYKKNKQWWDTFIDSEDWEYFQACGFWTIVEDKKIFTVNVNY